MFNLLRSIFEKSEANKDNLIDKKKYKMFLKCDKDEDVFDKIKVPKDKLSEEEFRILADLNNHISDFKNEFYSKKFKQKIEIKIKELRTFVTPEVFNLIEKSKN